MSIPSLDKLIPGIQLALFEILWIAQPTIGRVLLKAESSRLSVYFEWNAAPSDNGRQSAERLMQEVIDIAFEGDVPHTEFISGTRAPSEAYRELMSDAVFKAIATRHAPWRLEAGR